ncbi:MAG: hypothetical protein EOM92_20585 [Gammaproteobacteria bacterium]|nr:hypothetical protein [Gammaproteobacteria bacterium]
MGVDETERATRELTATFAEWGMTLPPNREALKALYASGKLTTEQMAILGAHLADLEKAFVATAEAAEGAIGSLGYWKTQGDLLARENELLGNGEEALRWKRKMEAAAIDETLHPILFRIYALEDEQRAIKDASQALEAAVAAERELLDEQHAARLEALATEQQAAQAALTEAQSALSGIQSAISSLRGADPVDELSRARASRQLAAWAAAGTLPDAASLNKTAAAAVNFNVEDFASEAAYRAARQATLANLLALEQAGLGQVDTAQATLEAIEQQIDQENAFYTAEVQRLDRLLEDTKRQVEIALGTWEATLSVAEALEKLQKLTDPAGDAIPMPRPELAMLPEENLAGRTRLALETDAQADELRELRRELAALRQDLAAIATAQTRPLQDIDTRLKKWDIDGLPAGRDDVVLLRAA